MTGLPRLAGPGQAHSSPRLRWLYAAVVAACLVVVDAACSAGSPTNGPLRPMQYDASISSCIPDSPVEPGITTWSSPVAYAENMYWNQSSAPLTVESVAMLDPHGLVLHGSVVYQMVHASHPLPISWGWNAVASHVPAREWAGRQRVPGAVIPPTQGPVYVDGRLSKKVSLWEIVLDVSAASPAGGWALGEVVRYRWRGTSYTLAVQTGIGIGTWGLPPGQQCDAQMNAIAKAFGQPTSFPSTVSPST